MADKKVLLDVQINMSDAVKQMASYEQILVNLTEDELKLKQAIKDQSTATDEDKEKMRQLREELVVVGEKKKVYRKELGEVSRSVQNNIIAEDKYKGTLKGLCATLSIAKDELRAMQQTDPKYKEQAEYVKKLNDQIKELEAEYGVHTRNVGNYMEAVQALRNQISQYMQDLDALKLSGQENTEEYKAQSEQLGILKGKLKETTGALFGMTEGGVGIDNLTASITAIIGVMSRVAQSFDKDTESGKRWSEVCKKLEVGILTLTSVVQIYDKIHKSNLLTKTADVIQTKALALSLKMEASASAKATGATVVQTVAQKTLNKVMAANPILIVVAAVAALVAAITGLVLWLNNTSAAQREATAAQREATAAQKEFEKQSKRTEAVLNALDWKAAKIYADTIDRNNKELRALIEGGATKEQIAAKEMDIQDELTQKEIDSAEEHRAVLEKKVADADASRRKQRKSYDDLVAHNGENDKKTLKQLDEVEKAEKEYANAQKAVADNEVSIAENQTKLVTSAYNRRQEALDKYIDNLTKSYDRLLSIAQEKAKRESIYQYDATKSAEENAELKFAAEQKYAAESFKLQQDNERKKLNLLYSKGKLTATEYKEQCELLNQQTLTFVKEQDDILAEHTRQAISSAVSLAGGKDLNGQIADVKSKYKEARDAIKSDATKSADEIAFYNRMLADKEADEIKQLKISAQDEASKKIEQRIKEQYQYDARQFSHSMAEQIEQEIEMQKAIIAEKKKAGLNTLADEAHLAALQAELRAEAAATELQLSWDNSYEQYKIRREYIEKELELEGMAADERAKLEQELAELNANYQLQRISRIEDYANQVMGIANSINETFSNLADSQIAKAESTNEAQKKILDKRLDAGLISQNQYDKKVAAMDEALDKRKAKIEREQAIREKGLAATQIAINTATAVMKIWAEVPKADFGAATGVLTGLAIAAGAAQLAAVVSQPIPTAGKGGQIEGATHAQGGVLVNTEGGERIVSASPSRAFPELLNLISYIGKHANIPDTGYASRALMTSSSNSFYSAPVKIDYDVLADKVGAKVGAALKDLKVYLSLEELRTAQRTYTKIEESAKM